MSGPGFVLVGGGARSGKSRFALRIAARFGGRRAFVATAVAFDDEMRARIERHVAERGSSFVTLEAPYALEEALDELKSEPQIDVVVLDCLTLWLSNLLLAGTTEAQLERRVEALAHTLALAPYSSIVVTNEVGMGLVPDSALGRTFRDVAGRAHQRLAQDASEVYCALLGTILRLRPSPLEVVHPGASP